MDRRRPFRSLFLDHMVLLAVDLEIGSMAHVPFKFWSLTRPPSDLQAARLLGQAATGPRTWPCSSSLTWSPRADSASHSQAFFPEGASGFSPDRLSLSPHPATRPAPLIQPMDTHHPIPTLYSNHGIWRTSIAAAHLQIFIPHVPSPANPPKYELHAPPPTTTTRLGLSQPRPITGMACFSLRLGRR